MITGISLSVDPHVTNGEYHWVIDCELQMMTMILKKKKGLQHMPMEIHVLDDFDFCHSRVMGLYHMENSLMEKKEVAC